VKNRDECIYEPMLARYLITTCTIKAGRPFRLICCYLFLIPFFHTYNSLQDGEGHPKIVLGRFFSDIRKKPHPYFQQRPRYLRCHATSNQRRKKPYPFMKMRMNYRKHRKIIVVDGLTGFVGGINVGDEYIGKHPRLSFWRDTHLRLEGNLNAGRMLTCCIGRCKHTLFVIDIKCH
jgi:hypothetical protein